MAEVVILGAGLTGLSAAYHLEQLGFFDYQIFEQEAQPGGLLRSVQQDGFTFDHTGHLLHVNDPYFKEFLQTVVGMEELAHIARQSFILLHDIYTPYPFQTYLYGHSPELVAQCIQGYVQRATHIRNPQSFFQWVLKHFGSGFGKHFFFPYNSKLLCKNIHTIHPSWTGRFVPQTSLSAILRGALTPTTPDSIGYNSKFWYPKKGGIQLLINKLVETLRNPIHLQHSVTHIDITRKQISFTNGKTVNYGKLISTLPLDVFLYSSTTPSRSSLKHAAQHLACTSVLNLNIGFDQPTRSNAHWVYLPEKSFVPYRIGFWHNLCPNSVPPGAGALYSETSYLANRTSVAKRDALIEKSRSQALSIAQIPENAVCTERLLNLKHAYVIYDQWREKNLPKILAALSEHDITSTGRFGAWKYNSMQEAVLDGRTAAHTVAPRQLVGAIKTDTHDTQEVRTRRQSDKRTTV